MDLGQVFTKKNIADYMTSLFTISKKAKILEPCFGEGAFLSSLYRSGFEDVTGYEIDDFLFETTKRRFPDYHLCRADFLSSSNDVKYDGIIMNPPYVRHEKIDDLEMYGITKKILKQNQLYQGLPSTANLYMYFIIKTLRLLDKKGELIVIFPSSWLKARSGEKFRNELQKQCEIEEEIYVSGNVFEEDALVEVLILKLRKSRLETSKQVKRLIADELGLREVVLENSCMMELGFRASFSEVAKVHRGLSTGWNEFFINPDVENDMNKMSILSTPKAVFGYRTQGAICDALFVVNENRSLSDDCLTYIGMAQKELAEKKKPKTLYEKYISGIPWYELNTIDSRGILFSYFVRNDMKFIMNDAGFLARDNFYIIQSRKKNGELLLFALLNNIYTYIQLECMGKKYGAGLLKLQRYDIENIMFPFPKEISNEDKICLVNHAKRLIESADKQCIIEITKVIEKYALIKAEDIINKYQNMKLIRLGDKHGKKCG